MDLLTATATIYLDGGAARQTYSLYKDGSAQRHASADDTTLRTALISALSAPLSANKTAQGNGVYRVRINSGNGYLVYKTPCVPNVPRSASIFHYHWNYHLDLPLTAT